MVSDCEQLLSIGLPCEVTDKEKIKVGKPFVEHSENTRNHMDKKIKHGLVRVKHSSLHHWIGF